MNERRRRELLHYGGPAAFLAAVTIAVLLIKAGLSGSSEPTTTAVFTPLTQTGTTHGSTRKTTTAAARYYTIQSGDTFGSVALAQRTTVDELVRLNPGVDPQSLHVGQRIRVR